MFLILLMTNENDDLNYFIYHVLILVLCTNLGRSIMYYYYYYGTLFGLYPVIWNIVSNIPTILVMVAVLVKSFKLTDIGKKSTFI
jgi:hypothetical protein